jgi:hypothetical protein
MEEARMQWTWNERADVNDLLEKVVILAQHGGFKAERIGRNKDVLEIGKTGAWRLLLGISAGLRLVVTTKENRTVVDVSGHVKEFALKGAVGAVGFMFIPLLPFAAYGAYVQNKLIDDVKKEINEYFDGL